MHKLPEVEEAKELMNEAMGWSTFRWLFEKPRVRKTADRANAALDHLNRAVKARWSDECKAIHKKLSGKAAAIQQSPEKGQVEPSSAEIELLIEKVIQADRAAHRARMSAEDTFDEAEKQMSTSLAKEGCKKAIHSWELHEKAIRNAEAVAKKSRVAS